MSSSAAEDDGLDSSEEVTLERVPLQPERPASRAGLPMSAAATASSSTLEEAPPPAAATAAAPGVLFWAPEETSVRRQGPSSAPGSMRRRNGDLGDWGLDYAPLQGGRRAAIADEDQTLAARRQAAEAAERAVRTACMCREQVMTYLRLGTPRGRPIRGAHLFGWHVPRRGGGWDVPEPFPSPPVCSF